MRSKMNKFQMHLQVEAKKSKLPKCGLQKEEGSQYFEREFANLTTCYEECRLHYVTIF